MLRICAVTTILLVGQLGQAFSQSGLAGRSVNTSQHRGAAEHPRTAPSKPATPPTPVKDTQPVTPAADYYPYDRRTGGM